MRLNGEDATFSVRGDSSKTLALIVDTKDGSAEIRMNLVEASTMKAQLEDAIKAIQASKAYDAVVISKEVKA